ncbi:adenylate/guanylate cyclase domain-containing protein [Rhodoferax lacus]|uniref:adenylate/guanylate cyclase domain-containing protein n=1 Tax=Rhodoferax lacus TaxID=2184758 RepID=UPI0013140EE9|nr:adenylate/guanylate cyclase domain-containing protein [Rhodoferax lacus]
MDDATVLFVDLVGSTALYQSLGNARAAELVSGVTGWIGRVCEAAGGRVIRRLGDGVLVSFAKGAAAFECAIALQRRQSQHNADAPDHAQVQIKIGLARGSMVESGTGWVGDVINLATDLSDRCGPEQILACGVSVDQIKLGIFARFRSLGLMHMLGKSEPVDVFQIEWKNDSNTGVPTVRAALEVNDFSDSSLATGIRLAWSDRQADFLRADLPIVLGRHAEADFQVEDPRISRRHARIYELDDALVLEDTSSYGTSVRFASANTVLTLRNQECVLHDDCEIAFGASFDQSNVPQLRLNFFS